MNAKNKKCTGLFGSVFGHRFEPRYSSAVGETDRVTMAILSIEKLAKNSTYSQERDMAVAAMTTIANILKSKDKMTGAYVKDVCIHCGEEVIYFPPSPPTPERRLEPDL